MGAFHKTNHGMSIRVYRPILHEHHKTGRASSVHISCNSNKTTLLYCTKLHS
jgi:hypothetical protein